MTDRIQHIINEIRSKKDAIKDLLKLEREKVQTLDQRINALVTELEEVKKAKLALETELLRLRNDLSTTQQELTSVKQSQLNEVKNVETVSGVENKGNVEIDELVREIEYCIGQLKNNA